MPGVVPILAWGSANQEALKLDHSKVVKEVLKIKTFSYFWEIPEIETNFFESFSTIR